MALLMIVGLHHHHHQHRHQIPLLLSLLQLKREKADGRPINEEEIEIETNDPTIKALLKRINRLEEQINQLLVKFDHLNVRAKSLLIATAVCSLALASILSMTPAARATLSPDDEVSTPQVWCVDNSQGNDWTDGC